MIQIGTDARCLREHLVILGDCTITRERRVQTAVDSFAIPPPAGEQYEADMQRVRIGRHIPPYEAVENHASGCGDWAFSPDSNVSPSDVRREHSDHTVEIALGKRRERRAPAEARHRLVQPPLAHIQRAERIRQQPL